MLKPRHVSCGLFLLAVGIAVAACDDKAKPPIGPETAIPAKAKIAANTADRGLQPSKATVGKASSTVTGAVSPTPTGDTAATATTADEASKPETADKESKTRPALPEGKKSKRKVKLIDPGRKPHKKLRFALKVGQQETMQMTMSSDMALTVGSMSLPKAKLPSTVMKMSMKVTDRTPTGDHRYTYKLTNVGVLREPGVKPEVVKAVKKALQGLQGLSGHAVVSERGFTREASVNVPPGASPQVKQMVQGMEQAMKQLAVPLPVEPIGEGARWKYVAPMTANGMKVVQIMKVELVSLKDKALTLKTVIKQKAKPQTISPPGMPAGASIDLLALKSSGKGEVQMLLNRLVPIKGTSNAKVDMDAKMTKPKPATMKMKMGMRVLIEGS